VGFSKLAVHLFLYGVDLMRGVFDLMEQRVLDLWLTSPGIDFRKAVDIAGWFHCHFFSKAATVRCSR
jgi:hypothetical protein